MNEQQRAVVQQGIDALGNITNFERLEKARAALRQLLEQPEPAVQSGSCGYESCDCRSYCKKQRPEPEQEPEHIVHSNGRYSPLLTRMMNKRTESNIKQVIHLYDEPPAAQPAAWDGLTDEEVEKLAEQVGMFVDKYGLARDAENGLEDGVDIFEFAKRIEAKLREKNGYGS